MPATVHEWCKKPRGFVLVTGATSSGKSISLAAMIDRINSTRSLHILTVEDPMVGGYPKWPRRAEEAYRRSMADPGFFSETALHAVGRCRSSSTAPSG